MKNKKKHWVILMEIRAITQSNQIQTSDAITQSNQIQMSDEGLKACLVVMFK